MAATLAQGAEESMLQHGAKRAGVRAETAMRELPRWLRASHTRAPALRLQAINHFFNTKIEFAADPQVWGQVDHWASPLETLNKGAGDCEDCAIAKYFSLLAIGMPAAQLRLVYARAQLDDGPTQAHRVLGYDPADGAEVSTLDNLVDAIRTTGQLADPVPMFSFNSYGLWQGAGLVGAGDPALRLSRWREVMAKVRAEGFY